MQAYNGGGVSFVQIFQAAVADCGGGREGHVIRNINGNRAEARAQFETPNGGGSIELTALGTANSDRY